MKRKILNGLALVFAPCSACLTAPASATLIISEYVEGSSFNKVIELFNYGSPIDLGVGFSTLEIYSNGSPTVSRSIDLSGVIDEHY